jgi:predicted permease
MGSQDSKALTSAFLYIFLPALIVGHLATQNLAELFDLSFICATAAMLLLVYTVTFFVNRFVLRRSAATSALAAFACSKIRCDG